MEEARDVSGYGARGYSGLLTQDHRGCSFGGQPCQRLGAQSTSGRVVCSWSPEGAGLGIRI